MQTIQLSLDLDLGFPVLQEQFDVHSYDHYIVAFSGGKDSLACLLHLLELGVPKSKIECWHHLVDGQSDLFFDYPITEDYCRKVCQYLEVPLYFSWREGGLEREMLRFDSPTAATWYETPQGLKTSGGNSNNASTRWRFPQIGGSMITRWCSSYSKISIGDAAIANQERFKGKRTLVLSGERREESASRAKYNEFEPHRTHTKSRHVDHWRAVLDWDEAGVWSIIQRWNIRSHPSYELGFGRCSCIICIFASNDQLASVYQIAPQVIQKMADYEKQFDTYWRSQGKSGYKIHREYTVIERVAMGNPYPMKPEIIRLALSREYYESVVVPNGEWELPMGAFSKDKSGPM
ncbi:phosphoadenosine phosphosulfate reductase family protein [Nostocales cyanobacterium LEGE 11386]|nr:phosphoadenosine phosphosulfate reductase family protein [Nostocales cyanobacterium LEGE 11386]